MCNDFKQYNHLHITERWREGGVRGREARPQRTGNVKVML
jgi:hypothetical protein